MPSTTIFQTFDAQRRAIRALGTRPARDARADAAAAIEQLYGLADKYGWHAKGPWNVHRPAYHGYGVISTHDSLRATLRCLDLCRCKCGCGGGTIAR